MTTAQLLYTEFETITASTEVPVLTGPQAQGDLMIIPWPEGVATASRTADLASAKPLAAGRTTIVSGNGGNHHDLVASPGVDLFMYPEGSLTVCLISVADGAEALLDHPEHGAVRIGTGVYVVRRQREQADVIRAVAD